MVRDCFVASLLAMTLRRFSLTFYKRLYLVCLPLALCMGYFRAFFFILLAMALGRSIFRLSANSNKYMATSANSSESSSLLFLPCSSTSFGDFHWKCSNTSVASNTKDRARSLWLWNCFQSRASRKALIFAVSCFISDI